MAYTASTGGKGSKRANYLITCPCSSVSETRTRLSGNLLNHVCKKCRKKIIVFNISGKDADPVVVTKPPAKKELQLQQQKQQQARKPRSCGEQAAPRGSALHMNSEKRRDIETLAQQLLQQHGLFTQGWTFHWDGGKTRAGVCRYSNKTICVSRNILDHPRADVGYIRNIILHEIAHALTPGHNHDDTWQRVALQIGCDGRRCHDLGTLSTPNYRLSCPCGNVRGDRFRLDKALLQHQCKACKKPIKITRLTDNNTNPQK